MISLHPFLKILRGSMAYKKWKPYLLERNKLIWSRKVCQRVCQAKLKTYMSYKFLIISIICFACLEYMSTIRLWNPNRWITIYFSVQIYSCFLRITQTQVHFVDVKMYTVHRTRSKLFQFFAMTWENSHIAYHLQLVVMRSYKSNNERDFTIFSWYTAHTYLQSLYSGGFSVFWAPRQIK